MDTIKVVEQVKAMFDGPGFSANVPYVGRSGTFIATLREDGIEVNNLGNQPFLHWSAFQETVCVMLRNGGGALRGNAQGGRLGSPDLPLDSIEGHIAQVVYGKKVGDSVFRRIVPIAGILVWAGVCDAKPKMLVLR